MLPVPAKGGIDPATLGWARRGGYAPPSPAPVAPAGDLGGFGCAPGVTSADLLGPEVEIWLQIKIDSMEKRGDDASL